MAGPKILVILYSRTGTTRRMAAALAAKLGGSVEEILEARGRDGFLGYWRSAIEARRKTSPDILPAKNDPASFDLVVIGTPIWGWSVSSPVRAYLTANKARLPATAFFCTCGGAGAKAAFTQMQNIVGRAPRATCVITARDLAAGGEEKLLTDIAAALRVPAASAV